MRYPGRRLCAGVFLFASLCNFSLAASFSPVLREAHKQLAQLTPLVGMLTEDVQTYQAYNSQMPPAGSITLTKDALAGLDPAILDSVTSLNGGVILFQFKKERGVKGMSPLLRERWIKLWPIRDPQFGYVDAMVCTTNLDDSYKMRQLSPGDVSAMLGEAVSGFEGCEYRQELSHSPEGYSAKAQGDENEFEEDE